MKIIVITGAMFAVLLGIGYGVWDQNQPYRVTAYFQSADQLVPGNEVIMNGVPAGTVGGVRVAPDGSSAGAIVTLDIAKRLAPLKQGTRAVIRPKGVLGVMYVELHPGAGAPIARGGTIPLQDTESPVTLDEVNDIFDPQTRSYVHTLTIEGGRTFQGRGQDVNVLLQQLPAISQDAADISAKLAARDKDLDALAVEFDRVARMMADEAQALKRDLANGAAILDVLARHEQKLQQELVEANRALGELNAAIGGHESSLNAILKEMPALLDDLHSFQDHSAAALGILYPCTGDILQMLAEMQSATGYKTPGGASDGQGFELRTNSQLAGASVGSYSPYVPCTGSKP